MLQAFITFHRGLYKLPYWTQLWLVLLVVVNAVLPYYFWPQPEAVTTLIIFLINFSLMIVITRYAGFTRLLGLGHALWYPLVIYLISRFEMTAPFDGFRLWMLAVIACNTISLVIDTVDVYRYAKGDRAELVAGL